AHISPHALAAWGPGYSAKIEGKNGNAGRSYHDEEGVSRNRPPGLGSDAGGGGGMGVRALPGLLALLIVGRRRRRWIALLGVGGAMLGIASAASRQSVVIGVAALLAYAGLSFVSRVKITRSFAAILAASG